MEKALEIVAVAKTNPSSGPVNAKGPIVPSKTSAFLWVENGLWPRENGGPIFIEPFPRNYTEKTMDWELPPSPLSIAQYYISLYLGWEIYQYFDSRAIGP